MDCPPSFIDCPPPFVYRPQVVIDQLSLRRIEEAVRVTNGAILACMSNKAELGKAKELLAMAPKDERKCPYRFLD